MGRTGSCRARGRRGKFPQPVEKGFWNTIRFAVVIRYSLVLLALLTSLVSVRASDFYVSPTSSAGGNGSIGNPWDLLTAFGQPASVKPGDTIWLRGGIYIPENPTWPALECYLRGTPAAPIIVRQYPGE